MMTTVSQDNDLTCSLTVSFPGTPGAAENRARGRETGSSRLCDVRATLRATDFVGSTIGRPDSRSLWLPGGHSC